MRKAMGWLAGVCVASVAAACSPGGNDGGPELKVTSAEEIDMFEFMVHALDPAARGFWSGWQVIESEAGEEVLFPETAEEWKRVEDGAATVLLLSNLLAMEDYRSEVDGDWDAYVDTVADVARRARLAAADMRSDEMEALGIELYEACNACHEALPEE